MKKKNNENSNNKIPHNNNNNNGIGRKISNKRIVKKILHLPFKCD